MLPSSHGRPSNGHSLLSSSSSRPLRRTISLLLGFVFVLVLINSFSKRSRGQEEARVELPRIDGLYHKIAAGLPTSPDWMRLSSSARDDGKPRNRNRTPRPRAALVSLVRESNLDSLLQTMRDVQWAFNDDAETNYDYIFFSEKPFSDHFKSRTIQFLDQYPNKPKVHFGTVSSSDWDPPAGIDWERLWHRWMRLKGGNIPYAMSKSYRQMCRFYSGALFHQPLLKDIDYYWRIEPDTRHTCRFVSHWRRGKDGRQEWIERDPFRYMRDNNKKYAFTISLKDYKSTIRSLMSHVNFWRRANPQYIAENNLFQFVSDDGHGFNRCHFWSNFEIGDLSFFRSEAYQSYYAALEKAGGFFNERWGDAPVHSIAASLLLDKDQLWHVDYAGYYHAPYGTCPFYQDPGSQCGCDPHTSVEYEPSLVSCQYKFDAAMGRNPADIVRAINGRNGFFEADGKTNRSATFREGIPVYEPPWRLFRAMEGLRPDSGQKVEPKTAAV